MPRIDRSGHNVFMDLIHALVHGELAYSTWTESGSITTGSNFDIRLRIGAKRHHSFGATVRLFSGSCRISLIEAPSNAGTGGTDITVYNRWRGSTKTPTTLLTRGMTGVNVTGAAATIPLGRLVVPSSGPFSLRVPATDTANAEWALKPNTDYILRLESIATFDADIGFLFYDISE